VGVSGRVDHRSGGIGKLGSQEHCLRDIVQHGQPIMQDLVCFVEGAPADDGGVVVVAPEHFQPLRHEARCGLLVVPYRSGAGNAPVAELTPQQVAEPVCVVEETFLEDLLVQAGTVESSGH